MHVLLLFFTLCVTTISDVFCGQLDKFQNDVKYECPLREEDPECYCYDQFGRLSITCYGLKTDSKFQSILKTLQEHPIKTLTIDNYNASSISTDIWKGQNIEDLNLRHIQVNDTSFSGKGKRHFQGLESSLRYLTIAGSFKKDYGVYLSLQLDHLKKLETAVFINTYIEEIGNDWFASGPKELYSLEFWDSGRIKLGHKAFASLSKLRNLKITGCGIKMVSRSMLPKPAQIFENLELQDNDISTIPDDMFSEMPALFNVDLSVNHIHVIQEVTLKQRTGKNVILDIRGNPLQCEKMKWICTYEILFRAFEVTCEGPDWRKLLYLSHFCKTKRNSFIKEG